MRLKRNGFTLLEMMIVLAIVAAAAVIAMPYIGNRNAQTKRALRELTVLSRELHTKAKLQGVVYRLVIDLKSPDPAKNGATPEQQYWVERAAGKTVLSEHEEADARERALETDPDKKKDPKGFAPDTSILHQVKTLPPGLKFEKIELTRLKDPVTTGKAFIHYLPEGLTDEAAIHIKGDQHQEYTISIQPLTGRAELITRSLSLKDMSQQ